MYVDNILRPSNSKPIAGHSIAVQAGVYNGKNVQYKYCKGVGHLLQHFAILKVN